MYGNGCCNFRRQKCDQDEAKYVLKHKDLTI
jgi:hypothetical protein